MEIILLEKLANIVIIIMKLVLVFKCNKKNAVAEEERED
jgi:hypothetical protein